MLNTSSAVQELFEERKKFLVIGVTGRTGSGCTTIANLLIKNWQDLQAPLPNSGDFIDNEQRKYRILYDFAKENWKSFHVIQIKNVITYYILLETYENFLTYICSLVSNTRHRKDEIKLNLDSQVKREYVELHARLRSLPKLNEAEDKRILKDKKAAYKFYFNSLPVFADKLKSALNIIESNSYTKIYQTIGDNVRSSGKALSGEFSPKNIFSIARSTNILIKLLRAINNHEDAFVVIDAIRNPFEATFFRDRYSAFYLLAVNCPNLDRVERLQTLFDLTPSQVYSIDKKEYERKKDGHHIFISQDIAKCI